VVTRATVEGGDGERTGRAPAVAESRGTYWVVRGPWPSAAARDHTLADYLHPDERRAMHTLNARAQDDRGRGRIAAKDAVRHWLAAAGVGWLDPRQVRIDNDAAGRPRVDVDGAEPVAVSLAHRRSVAVASVAPLALGAGIDVEVVEPRGTVFARLAMSAAELRLGDGRDHDEWVTRVWTVKEAVAKADGTGLRGRPKDFVVREVRGAWTFAHGRWVHSAREGELIVSAVADPGRARSGGGSGGPGFPVPTAGAAHYRRPPS